MTTKVAKVAKITSNETNDKNWKPADAWLNCYLVNNQGQRTKLGDRGIALYLDVPADKILIDRFTQYPESVKELGYGPVQFEFQLVQAKAPISAEEYSW